MKQKGQLIHAFLQNNCFEEETLAPLMDEIRTQYDIACIKFEYGAKSTQFGKLCFTAPWQLSWVSPNGYKIEILAEKSLGSDKVFDVKNVLNDVRFNISEPVFSEALSCFDVYNIFRSIPDIVAYKSLDGVYQLSSIQADQLYENSVETLVGHHIDQVYPPHAQERVKALDQEVLDKKRIIRKEVSVHTDQGEKMYDAMRAPVFKDGAIQGVISMSRDISQSVTLKNEYEESLKYQALLLDISKSLMNVPTGRLDDTINETLKKVGTFLDVARAYVFFYEFDKGMTHNAYEWTRPGIDPQIQNLQDVPISDFWDEWVEEHIKGKIVKFEDVDALEPNSVIHNMMTAQNIQSLTTIPLMNQEECLGFVGFDSVDYKRIWTEKEEDILAVMVELFVGMLVRERYQEALVQANEKVKKISEAKSEFLSNMSHEIRTPLSAIYNTSYLLNRSDMPLHQKAYLETINYSIETLSGIISNILDLNRIEAGFNEIDIESFSLEKELYEIIKSQQTFLDEKNLNVYFDYDYALPAQVKTDRKKVRQILINLINNSIKFTDEGSITIKVQAIKMSKADVTLRFEVIDTGIGIDLDNHPNLYEKFYQIDSSVKKRYQGSGIGLYIIHNHLESLHSTLNIHSKPGVGSTFYFDISVQYHAAEAHRTLELKDIKIGVMKQTPFYQNLEDLIRNEGATLIPLDNASSNPSVRACDVIIFSGSLTDIEQTFERYVKESNIPCIYYCHPFSFSEQMAQSLGFYSTLPYIVHREYFNKIMLRARNASMQIPTPQNHLRNPKQATVLLAEDNRLNMETFTTILKQFGLLVIQARDGEEVLKAFDQESFDLAFIDLHMPKVDGFEIMKHITPSVPVIAVSANVLEETRQHVLKSGMQDFISKPIHLEAVKNLLRKYLNIEIDTAQAESDLLPSRLAVFDLDAVLERTKRNITLIHQMIELFMEQYPSSMRNITTAAKNRMYDQIIEHSHYLKGSTVYISADRLTEICNQLINAAENKSHDTIDKYLNLLEPEGAKLKDVLNRWLKEF